ncbi:MAG TPA: dihydrolipoamide acetyltransferase family protein [Candidatus Brocadiia bacterium]|nr:2-oxo acid dehydrogenase subunit E2 [Planctomycetota bacterium]MDO8093955.1 dihydrolipoamide acetyltransferase family protein [Candidatus Brocadiales bacterium]
MPVEVIMPQMGESVAQGTILRWMVKEGDRVEKDQSIVEISTDKVDTEVPSPASGIIKQILRKEQETIPVGTPIAVIEEVAAKEVAPSPPPTEVVKEEAPAPKPAEVIKEEMPSPPPSPPPSRERVRVVKEEAEVVSEKRYSPLVKRLAKEYGVDLEKVAGTGIGGRVTKQDVLDFAGAKPPEAPAPAPPSPQPSPPRGEVGLGEVEKETLAPLTPKRKIIAERMVQSKREAAHVTTTFEVDMTKIAKFREANKEAILKKDGVNLTYLPFVILSTASALKEFTILNSMWTDKGIVIKKYINIGIATSLEDGLIVPVIKDADKKDLIELAKLSQDLSQRARTKKLKPDEVQGGTFTITNYGANGSLFGNPIIMPPQVAILGMGTIAKKPIVIDDAIAIRSMMYLSLSFDHRVLDGAQADQFLRKIKDNLEGWSGQPSAPRPAQEREKYEKVPGTESGYGGVW